MAVSTYLLLIFVVTLTSSFGFQCLPQASYRKGHVLKSSLDNILDSNEDILTIRKYLKEYYPGLSQIMELNDSIWKSLGGKSGFTIFAPNSAAFAALGEQKQEQLLDERNLETTQKIAAYHVIGETVTASELYNSGGVITMGGEIPVDRSKSGGMFGVGGKEDGGVTVNNAKIVESIELGSGVLHEVEGLISPNIMWRYMDQLRIPGSK